MNDQQHYMQEFLNYIMEEPDPDTTEFFLYQKDDVVGIISCIPSFEDNDDHCEQCRNELLCLRFKTPEIKQGYHLASVVGTTKFERIRSGYRAFEGLDLTNATIFDMSLNVL